MKLILHYDFYYKDGRTCKVFSHDWSDDGKWSEPIDFFKILLEDGEALENVSNNDLYMTPETLENMVGVSSNFINV